MSRRQRDVQQGVPHQNNNNNKPSTLLPPQPASFIPMVGMGTTTTPNHNNNNIPSSSQNTNNQQRQLQQVQNLLKFSPSVYDFSNFDLSSLGDAELCAFLSHAIETLASPLFLPSQPTHSRLAASLVRCLGTMPWGRVFSVATIPANLPVENNKISGGGEKGSKDQQQQQKSASANPPGTFLFRLPSSNRARAYPTSMHDLHAFAKTLRRQISALYALLAIKLANFSPSSIPDILSATLQYFSHLPPAAEVSMNLWYSLPPALSTSEGGGATTNNNNNNNNNSTTNHHQHQNVPSSSAPSSCRAYASALTTWLDSEIDTHIFRVIASLLARYEEYQSQGSISRSNLSMQHNAHNHNSQDMMFSSLNDENNNSTNSSNNVYLGLLRVCMTVLENSVPKKRWPVVAHHLSWFSVMGKFFQSREIEAMAKALGELEFSQNAKYCANPSTLITFSSTANQNQNQNQNQQVTTNSNNNNTIPSIIGSSSIIIPSPRTSGVMMANSSSSTNNNNNNPTYSTSGPASSIAHRAQSTLSEESFSRKILHLMLTGLLNLETLARQSRENSYGARRCAAIVVDSLVSVGFLKVQQQAQQQQQTNNNNATENDKKKDQQHFPAQNVASPHQSRNTISHHNNSRNSYFGRPSSLFAFSLDVDVLFSVVLQHYLQHVIVLTSPSVCCVHAVVICTALGLDYVTISNTRPQNHDDDDDENEEIADDDENNNLNKFSCVQSLVLACLNRLGKSFSTCVHLDLFLTNDDDDSNKTKNSSNSNNGSNNENSSSSANMQTRNPPTTGTAIAADTHVELMSLSHLAACLKSLFTLAEQSPDFLKTEVFEKRSFRRGSSANKKIVKALTDLIDMLISHTKPKNNNKTTTNSQRKTAANGSAANWLIEEILKPFAKYFGFSSSSQELSTLLKSTNRELMMNSSAGSPSRRSFKNGKDEDDDDNDSEVPLADEQEDEEDGEAAIDRFFNNRKNNNNKNNNKKSRNEEENNNKNHIDAEETTTTTTRRFEIIRAPDVSFPIWRSYNSFMKELLPFTIK